MIVCYLADAASTHTQRWARYFADKGYDVHVVSPRPSDSSSGNIRLHLIKRLRPQIRIISFPVTLAYEMIQIKRLIKRIRPDILHAHYTEGYGRWGALAGFHPFVVTAWGSDALLAPKRSRISSWTLKHVLRRADMITCGGEYMKTKLIELGAVPDKISLVSWGIDTQKFRPGHKSARVQAELGISGSPTVMSLRWLEPQYDIESLVASIPLVLKEIPEAKFVIAGDGLLKTKLQELANSLGVSASIKFTGQIPHDELPAYLASVDICVSTSLLDGGLSQCTAEAMACGLPVIITDNGDNREWVQDGANGYIVPVRSPEVLASRIVHLMRNKELGVEFGRVNRQLVEERDNWQTEMSKMDELYKELLARYKK